MELTPEKNIRLIENCKEATAEYEAACAKYEQNPAVIERRAFDNKVRAFCEEFVDAYDDAYGYECLSQFNFRGDRLHWTLEREGHYRHLSVPTACLTLSAKDIYKHDCEIGCTYKTPLINQLEVLNKQRIGTKKAIDGILALKIEAPGPLRALQAEQDAQLATLQNDLARIAATMWLQKKE
jgi:hypothetical protein